MGSAGLAFVISFASKLPDPSPLPLPAYARWLLILIHSPSVLAASITQLIDEVKLATPDERAALSSQLSICIPVKIALPLN